MGRERMGEEERFREGPFVFNYGARKFEVGEGDLLLLLSIFYVRQF